MSISEFLKSYIFLPRLRQKGCLVVYDPDLRYRDICLEMAKETLTVIDATESGLVSRSAALLELRSFGNPNTTKEGVLVYVPVHAPITDEEKQHDPFALYSACGGLFPDGAGDEYEQICLRAKPDHSTEIRRVFTENPNPSFAVIDAIAGGVNWPNLRALLKVDSANDILFALLAPSSSQENSLKGDDTWVQEARDFLRLTLGLELKTRAKSWTAIAEEVWRFLLFSEFVFDLPGALPASLAPVPRAAEAAEPMVEYICERLRSDLRTQSYYIDRAEQIERDLELPASCSSIEDLGERDTFPFEERTLLKQAITSLMNDDLDRVRTILVRRKNSVWLGKGESQSQWGLVDAALSLVGVCSDYDRQLGEHVRSQSELLDFYAGSLRDVDRKQREFEQVISAFHDFDDTLSEVVHYARSCYRKLSEKVQTVFIKHLETQGWPPAGRVSNAEVFDRFIAPRLQERGRKIAYLMVDALRYELGVALENRLSEDGPVELHSAYAQLPTVTIVGMASLLPNAAVGLALCQEGDSLVPMIDGAPVGSVSQRMGFLRSRLGDRFAEMRLDDFVRSKKVDIASTVDLLVLRSVEIDDFLETNPESTLKLIPDTISRIRATLHKLRDKGFHEVVIATDHGFYLNAQAEAGDVCSRPGGSWSVSNYRSMLGQGGSDSNSLILPCEKAGIRGDYKSFATPRSMAPYRSGLLYFHGGVSLAEAVVPVLVVKLESTSKQNARQFSVELSYKGGAKRITTLRPVVEVIPLAEGLFSLDSDFEILLEAQDVKGNVVGEAKPGGAVNPATRTITLKPGKRESITLCMLDGFEGKFTVKALDPSTLKSYSDLILETDYAV
ncbi:PglZ domain-containing protein [Geomonas sp. Red69]|uniref:PglZ domain-containing protein n=1 Tax=Geomonas diazotrophica TaxID=2843197 RepID=UPI001C0FFFCA|nr:PglZ domain-containing protein [Geomonas diazotrophica]MBU5638828.1 PglZ domain-containing protein [Geomonas diazotrophica]